MPGLRFIGIWKFEIPGSNNFSMKSFPDISKILILQPESVASCKDKELADSKSILSTWWTGLGYIVIFILAGIISFGLSMTLFIVFKAEIFVASPPLTDLIGLVEGFVY